MMSYIGVYVVALGTIRETPANPPGNLWCQVQFQRLPPIKKTETHAGEYHLETKNIPDRREITRGT